MDSTAELTYLLELRDTAGLALDVFDGLAPTLEAWERGRARMERPRQSVGDPEGPEAFTATVRAQRDAFIAIEAFLSLWARTSLLLAPSPRGRDTGRRPASVLG